MLSDYIESLIIENFKFTPTEGQRKIIAELGGWLADVDHQRVFIMNGYAGTGKTTLVSAIVSTLEQLKLKPVMLAPTGRAAKVMARHSGRKASTIHKRIYRQRTATSPEAKFSLDMNREKDAVFIVDEASMLSSHETDNDMFGSGSLLDDFFTYVRQGTRCRIMFVGDSAQLPPIGHDISPALDPRRISDYGDVIYTTLDEVMRQETTSGILFNATLIRCMIESGIYEPPRFDMSYPDFRAIDGGEFMEMVETCYSRYGKDETIVITRSNKRANRFNEGIRRHVLYAEEEIESGDMLMVVKNNYYYTESQEDSKMDFLANGDTAILTRLRRFEEFYGFRFAKANLRFGDYDDTEMECTVLLDTLGSESPSLTREESNRLFYAVAEDFPEIKSKAKRYKEVRENPYYNAVQIKFAYAVTAHKAQGGEWQAVFVDKMLFGDETMSKDLMRWLYTAITRAGKELYLVNFDERFFDE